MTRWTGFALIAALAVGCGPKKPLPLDLGEPPGPVSEEALHVEWTGVDSFAIPGRPDSTLRVAGG